MTSKKEKTIIQISGLKRSGKDYTANLMKKEIESNTDEKVEILSFAEPMKTILSKTLSIEPELLDQIKNNKSNIYYSNNKEMEFVTDARSMIMHFGNDAMKPIFGDDVWVKIMKEKIRKSDADVIIISDFRFLVEHLPHALTVLVVNDDIKNDTDHPSENELENFDFDIILDNTKYCLTIEKIKEEMIKQLNKMEQNNA